MPEVVAASPPGDELGSGAFVSESSSLRERTAHATSTTTYAEELRKKQPTSHGGGVGGSVFVTKRKVRVIERTEVFRYKKTSMLAIIVA